MDKTRLPTLQELTGYAGKLCHDIKKSIMQIFSDYQKNHPEETVEKTMSSHEPEPTDNEAGLKKPKKATVKTKAAPKKKTKVN